MHTSKYAKMAKCSTDTALRDIRGLVDHGILVRNPGGGRSTSYRLALSPAAGEYREDIHLFKNQQFSDILTSLTESIKLRHPLPLPNPIVSEKDADLTQPCAANICYNYCKIGGDYGVSRDNMLSDDSIVAVGEAKILIEREVFDFVLPKRVCRFNFSRYLFTRIKIRSLHEA